MSAYTLPKRGTLFDSSVNVSTNSISDGPGHSGKSVPAVLSGSAGGFLKTGIYVRTTGYTSKILNTMIAATGCKNTDGTPVTQFNDPDPKGVGLITEIVA